MKKGQKSHFVEKKLFFCEKCYTKIPFSMCGALILYLMYLFVG